MSSDALSANSVPAVWPRAPVRVLTLRGVDGAGGGADKIILRNAERIDPGRIAMSLLFFRHENDVAFDLDQRAAARRLDYHEIRHRGPFDRRVFPQLIATARSLRPDLLHAHEYKANYFARRLARQLKIPVVSTAHGWTGHSWRERWFYYPVDKRQLRHFDAVIAVSSEIRDELLKHGACRQRVHVLLNGVDPNRYQRDVTTRMLMRKRLGYGNEHCVLGAVGRIEQQKRFDLLLTAFRELANERAELRLVIAGEGSLLPALRHQAARLELGDRVHFLGHCAEMRDVYQAFDLFVQTSDYEGTPTVVVEAMALEIPVVATDVGGTRELITDERDALLVPPGDMAAWCRAVRRALDEPAATAERTHAARRRVETELNFDRRIERLSAIYESLVRR